MVKILLGSTGRKIACFLVAALVTAINKHFGINLDSDTIFGLWGTVLTLIHLDSHFNIKQFISSAINALAGAAQTATTGKTTGNSIKSVTAPPMSFNDMQPYLNSISNEMNSLYAKISTGKYNDATQEAINDMMAIHDYLTKNKGRNP